LTDNSKEISFVDDNKAKEPAFLIFIIVSLIFHVLLFFSGFININLGKSDFDIQKSSLNVTVVESSETLSEKKDPVSQKASGKNIDIETKKTDEKPEIVKKTPLFSGAKKKLPEKKIIEKKAEKKKQQKKIEQKNDLIEEIAAIKKEIQSDSSTKFDKVLKDIDSFKNEIDSQNKGNTLESDNLFSDLEKGSEKSDKINIYRYKIAYEVEKKWALPEELINKEDMLETSIVFKVLKDGTISSIWFDRKSGNEYFDNSVYNAVKKAEPLPPHPEGIDKKSVFVGLRFTPEGLR